MDKIELAKWLHDNYEEGAKKENWNTQENCKVEFDTLPDANKRTMIEIADRLLNFNLLRLHFVVGRSEQLCDHPKNLVVRRKIGAIKHCLKCGKNL